MRQSEQLQEIREEVGKRKEKKHDLIGKIVWKERDGKSRMEGLDN